MTSILAYQDPLINLVKDPELNRSKEKTNRLLALINGFQSGDYTKIKKKCILGFQVLRDLEKLELRTKNWEFMSLDFSIESILNDDRISETKSKFNREIAKKVLSNCIEMHRSINSLTYEINTINSFIQTMSTLQYISDAGTILTQLSLRTLELKNKLLDNLTILYSKLKLINIGIDLETLLENCNFEKFDKSTIQSYREFVNQLLRQLKDAIKENDSIEIMECIDIVNDVEQMFEAISVDESKFIKEEPYRERELSISSTSTNSLQKTTLQDEMPNLLAAFDTLKNVEEEIREIRHPKSTSSSMSSTGFDLSSSGIMANSSMSSSSSSTSTAMASKPVHFGPLLPSVIHNQPPQEEILAPVLSHSYIFDNSLLNKLGIRPQVISVETKHTSGNSLYASQLTEKSLSRLNMHETKKILDEKEEVD